MRSCNQIMLFWHLKPSNRVILLKEDVYCVRHTFLQKLVNNYSSTAESSQLWASENSVARKLSDHLSIHSGGSNAKVLGTQIIFIIAVETYFTVFWSEKLVIQATMNVVLFSSALSFVLARHGGLCYELWLF